MLIRSYSFSGFTIANMGGIVITICKETSFFGKELQKIFRRDPKRTINELFSLPFFHLNKFSHHLTCRNGNFSRA